MNRTASTLVLLFAFVALHASQSMARAPTTLPTAGPTTVASTPPASSPVGDALSVVYESLAAPAFTDNKPNYRIPAIVQAKNGDLLAFMERRIAGIGDVSNNEIVMRRSTDEGRTWGRDQPIQVGDWYANSDATPLVDSTGRVWLWYMLDRKRFVVMHSDDDGRTWTDPQSIHDQIIPREWDTLDGGVNRGPESATDNKTKSKAWHKNWNQSYGIGPGAAAVEIAEGPKRGRIVVPARCTMPSDGKKNGVAWAFFTDDRGVTWKRGGVAVVHGGENQIVELAGGRLVMNARDGVSKNRPDRILRRFAGSDDGGETWSEFWNLDLDNPQVHAAMKRYRFNGRDVLLYVSPDSKIRDDKYPYGRRKLSLRYSTTGGRTWSSPQTIFPDRSSYADLLVFGDGSVAVIYERGLPGNDHYWDELAFVRLNIDFDRWK